MQRLGLGGLLLGLTFALATFIYGMGLPSRQLFPLLCGLIAACLAFLGYALCLLIHELGHALAARAVGWRVLVFAVYPLAMHFPNRQVVRLRQRDCEEIGGFVAAVPARPGSGSAIANAVWIAAGPLANFLLAAGALSFRSAPAHGYHIGNFRPDLLLFALALQSLYVGMANLLGSSKAYRSDGQILFQLGRDHFAWSEYNSFIWLSALARYRIRVSHWPQWLLDQARRDAEGVDAGPATLSAWEAARVLDRSPVDAAEARRMLDAHLEHFGASAWHSSCDAYLAAVWEGDGERAKGRLWPGETPPALEPLRLAAEAAVAARLGHFDAARVALDRMDAALRAQSPFRDDTFRDIRRQVESLLG